MLKGASHPHKVKNVLPQPSEISGNLESATVFDHPMISDHVTTCASESGSGTRRNPTGDDRVSSAHERGSGAKVASSTSNFRGIDPLSAENNTY